MNWPSFKSEVIDSQNPLMWGNNKINSDDSTENCSIPNFKDPSELQKNSNHPTAIVIVEPRQNNSKYGANSCPTTLQATSSGSISRPEWFILPHSVDLNNDVLRLVGSLSTVIQILTRMTNAATQELGQHPEREHGFAGLRMLLNYADQMYTTLLQPQPFPSDRLPSRRDSSTQSYSLFHHLFEPLLGFENMEEELLAATTNTRLPPYRVAAVSASTVGHDTTDTSTGSSGSSDASEPNTN